MLEIESLFNESYYFGLYPEAKAPARSGFTHFLQVGRVAANDPGPFFDSQFYLTTNTDVAAEVAAGKTTAIDHFLRHGQFEGRDPIAEFNTQAYLAGNADVSDAVTTTRGNEDPLTAYEHFLEFGQYEGRESSPNFNPSFYLQNNPDVAAAIVAQPSKLTAIRHYLEYGDREGRLGLPPGLPDNPTSPIAPTPQPRSAFSPAVDGFGFENYKSSSEYLNLTPVEMRRMFGDVVVANTVKSDGSFKLTPTAEKWMEWANSTMKDGHCEGLAVLSLQMFEGKIDPKAFGADRVADLKLEGNPKLQRELAYWYATALLTSGDSIKTSPNDALAALRTNFETTGFAGGTLQFSNPDASGGHSVTPIGLTDLPDGRVSIAVYDGNYPQETREILIDPATNTWFYSPDATLTEDDYRGDAATDTLGFAPIAPRLGQQVWPFGLEADSTTSVSPQSNKRINDRDLSDKEIAKRISQSRSSLPQSATQQPAPVNSPNPTNNLSVNIPVLAFENEYSTGHPVQGHVIAPPGSPQYQYFPGSLRSWENPAVVSYPLSTDGEGITEFTVQKQPQLGEDPYVSYIGAGYVFEVSNLDLDGSEADTILIDANDSLIAYLTTTGVVPELFVGFETVEADYNLYLSDFELEVNDAVLLDVDAAARLVRVQVDTTAATGDTIFSFAMERIDDESIDIFDSADDGIVLADGEVLLIDYSSWDANGSPLRMGYDTNNNRLLDADELFEVVDEGDTFDGEADFVFDPAFFGDDPFFEGIDTQEDELIEADQPLEIEDEALIPIDDTTSGDDGLDADEPFLGDVSDTSIEEGLIPIEDAVPLEDGDLI
jgi:hypothetical protein